MSARFFQHFRRSSDCCPRRIYIIDEQDVFTSIPLPRHAKSAHQVVLSPPAVQLLLGHGFSDAEENVRGEFRKEDVNVFLYTEGARCAYVDKNDNILTPGNAYVATIRRFSWLPVLLIVIFLALATALSVLLSAYFMSRSESIEYAPVLFVASEDGTQWEGSENLPVFVNEAFGDNVIAPGMNGTYRFTLRNDNDDPLIFLLEFSEDNEHGIALLYRLKRDGVYIAGHDTHVGTEDICVYDMTIEPNSTTVFELEWLWKDNDEVDTEAGQNEATYVLHIAFSAYVGRQGQA